MTEKVFFIWQCAAHSVCLFVSLYIIVPVVIHVSDFRGHCALFSCGHFVEEDGRFDPDWASKSYCIYSILIGFFAFLSSLSQLLLKLRLIFYNLECSFLSAFIDFFADCLITLLVLLDSGLISAGFYRWCDCVTQEFESCDAASSQMVIGKNSTIVAKNFAFQLKIVQIGVWSLFVCMTFQLMLSMRKVLLYHERENLIAAMARERIRYQQQE